MIWREGAGVGCVVHISAVGANKDNVLCCSVDPNMRMLCACAPAHGHPSGTHTQPRCWHGLQMGIAGNRLGRRNPDSPESLSQFWIFVTI